MSSYSRGTIPQRYLNARQAADYLGIGDDSKAVDTLYQWVHRGKVPYSKLGRVLRFDILALDKLMAENAQPARRTP